MIESCTDREGHSLRFLVWKALKQYRTASLWQFLYDRDVIVRSAAARELQIRGGKFVYEQTKTLLKHDSKDIRELAAFILGQLGTPRLPFKTASTRDLLMLLKIEKNTTVRATAVCSLGQLHATKALPTIISSANDPSPAVRGKCGVCARNDLFRKAKNYLDTNDGPIEKISV